MPVDPEPVQVDGVKLLIFPDGVMAKTHLGFTTGSVSHFATCEKAQSFKKKKAATVP